MKTVLFAVVSVLLAASACFAQAFTQRGYLETGLVAYPQTGEGDSSHAVGAAILHYEVFYKLSPSLRFSAGVEAETDTHHEVERDFSFSWWDRQRQRPVLAIQNVSASYRRGPFTLELGKQFIRWGKADILNPTDRFAPRDYVDVVQNKFLAVTGARLTVGDQANTIELVFVPRFTPSRIPLVGQRWVVEPALPLPDVHLPLLDDGARYPGGSQFGARWNHIGQRAEFSLSYYSGSNHLPLIDGRLVSRHLEPYLSLKRLYPSMRMAGADAAIPFRLFTIKAETGYFNSPRKDADDYLIYVVQAERQQGEWLFVGGYAGQYVAHDRLAFDFAPDRGLTKAFLGRAGYTIDTNRSVALETAVRQNGKGSWVKIEYTQSFREHWRVAPGFTWIRGEPEDFLGQYHRNSFASLTIRYSI